MVATTGGHGGPVKSSPPTNQHPVFLQAGCPSCCPTNSVKALKGKIFSMNLNFLKLSLVDFWSKMGQTDGHAAVICNAALQAEPHNNWLKLSNSTPSNKCHLITLAIVDSSQQLLSTSPCHITVSVTYARRYMCFTLLFAAAETEQQISLNTLYTL